MVCRIGWLLTEPTITEVTETKHVEWDFKTRTYRRWTEPLLFPEYKVGVYYDYHGCCGRDTHTFTRATREDAERLVDDIKNNRISWLRYDPEELAAYEEELAEYD